ncbi:agmatine deiminase family protein [Bradyrhizobium sp. NAS96.2]|uniref:agmatine deiminase family protein n=1 Tax=Bradyrhizobium sp. NAS96.2 TaxID=1680160 RepID=UPI00093E721F|nr:agmatine deiminase family protein [Bradyrhizobium sp. NAS96.2]OKO76666.1 hypothetical protein AC628_17565 [Bradyrhizobium sp. NAS96.2]
MPDESAPHAATWMAFAHDTKLWRKPHLLPVVRQNLALIAQATAAHDEPVNMLVHKEDYEVAARLCGPRVTLVVQPFDDVWTRDSAAFTASRNSSRVHDMHKGRDMVAA